MVKQILKIIIWCAAAREILLLLGLTELSKSLGAGFGYGGLMIGWGLKEVRVMLGVWVWSLGSLD